MAKARVSQHSGREGSASHNDRSFLRGKTADQKAEIAPHIREEDLGKNITWCWSKDKSLTFEQAEIEFYKQHYGAGIEARNERYREERHPERCKSVEDVYRAKQTRPEEMIVQIGNRDLQPTAKDFLACVNDLFRELQHWNRDHGNHMHILDIAIHVDEATPHAHIRRVWDFTDGRGELHLGQAAALRAAGIQRPDMTKPAGRYNNEKITFDAEMRQKWQEICKARGFDIETEARVGVRHKDKAEFIADKLQKEIEDRQREISAADQRIADQKTELTAQERRIEESEAMITERESRLESVNRSIRSAEGDLEDRQQKISAADQQIGDQTAVIASKKGQIQDLDKNIAEKEDSLKRAEFKLEHANLELSQQNAQIEKLTASRQHAEDQRLETLRERDAARKGRDVEGLFERALDVIAKNTAPKPPTVYETIPEKKGGLLRGDPRPETVVIAKADLDALLSYREKRETGHLVRDEIQKAVEDYKKTADLALMNKIDYTRIAENQQIAALEEQLKEAKENWRYYADRCDEKDKTIEAAEAQIQKADDARYQTQSELSDLHRALALSPAAKDLVDQTSTARLIERIVWDVENGFDNPFIVHEQWQRPKYWIDGKTYDYTGMLRLYANECREHDLQGDPNILGDLQQRERQRDREYDRDF